MSEILFMWNFSCHSLYCYVFAYYSGTDTLEPFLLRPNFRMHILMLLLDTDTLYWLSSSVSLHNHRNKFPSMERIDEQEPSNLLSLILSDT